VTFKLWESWDKDALVLDRAAGIYADPSKVHYVDYKGSYFQSRGPLNIPRSPQGRPVIIQAGSSGRGKAFAARWSEVIFALQPSLTRMQAYMKDVHAALAAAGRPPDAAKVLMAVMPFIGATHAEAEAKRDLHDSLVDPRVGLSTLAAHANADFSDLPLDANVNDIADTGSQGNLAALRSIAGDGTMTISEAGRIYGSRVMCPRVIGTPEDVADHLISIVDSGAADGFVISPAFLPDTFEDFVRDVTPILKARGYLPSQSGESTLRDRLGGHRRLAINDQVLQYGLNPTFRTGGENRIIRRHGCDRRKNAPQGCRFSPYFFKITEKLLRPNMRCIRLKLKLQQKRQ
jgi:FMN-dependent oxidoreductase (nitrilotriacetate monooxygenase family)